jgi:IS605 OrfB family transposase
MAELRTIAAPFVASGPSGVATRDRLRNLAAQDEKVLMLAGRHLGTLASEDLKTRCTDGLQHDIGRWAARKRDLTPASSSRWAGSITKATNDQWALGRRCLAAHIGDLDAGIRTLRHRLSLPIGESGTRKAPGGYRSRREWFKKSRRLACLESRRIAAAADWQASRVRVVRGGSRLANTRHNLAKAQLTGDQWRARWEAARMFLTADGEPGKRFGNETIRVTPAGGVIIKLPAPLAHLANAPHGRYVLSCTVTFAHRGEEWASRIEAGHAVAYAISYDADRERWYITASWQRKAVPVIPLAAALMAGCIGVDTNNDHLAAWLLDIHGNPVGAPHRFLYDLSGSADHRDAQIRHALTRLLHWAAQSSVKAIAIEDLDFREEKTREKHGRRKAFRSLLSRFPTAQLRDRLISMAAELDIAVVSVDPAYTSRWGAQHWQKPMTALRRKTTRHDAASIAIGRRALGYPIRRRTAPPRSDQSDRCGYRAAQAGPDAFGRDGTRPPATDRAPGGPSPSRARKREPSTPSTVRGVRSAASTLVGTD